MITYNRDEQPYTLEALNGEGPDPGAWMQPALTWIERGLGVIAVALVVLVVVAQR